MWSIKGDIAMTWNYPNHFWSPIIIVNLGRFPIFETGEAEYFKLGAYVAHC